MDTIEKNGLGFVNKEGWLSPDGLTWYAVFGGIRIYDGLSFVKATLVTAPAQ